jgi:hypothetical protein
MAHFERITQAPKRRPCGHHDTNRPMPRGKPRPRCFPRTHQRPGPAQFGPPQVCALGISQRPRLRSGAARSWRRLRGPLAVWLCSSRPFCLQGPRSFKSLLSKGGEGLVNPVLNSPTHKRAEGRAAVWGSEFTSKDAILQGGSSRNRCWAKCRILVMVTDWW